MRIINLKDEFRSEECYIEKIMVEILASVVGKT